MPAPLLPADTAATDRRLAASEGVEIVDARDEVFASASESDWRRDASHEEAGPDLDGPSAGLSAGRLVETLRFQLAALDAQRSDLARLLKTLG